MGFLSFLKSTNPKPKEEKKRYEPKFEPMPVPEPPKRIQLEVYATKADGEVVSFPYDKILNDGTCLVSDDGKYYHTYINCGAVAVNWKLITIEEAEKAGYLPCLICDEKIRDLQNYEGDDYDV